MIKPPRLLIDESEKYAKLIIDRHADSVEKYKINKGVVSFLMNEAMRECRGFISPLNMREALIEELELRLLGKE